MGAAESMLDSELTLSLSDRQYTVHEGMIDNADGLPASAHHPALGQFRGIGAGGQSITTKTALAKRIMLDARIIVPEEENMDTDKDVRMFVVCMVDGQTTVELLSKLENLFTLIDLEKRFRARQVIVNTVKVWWTRHISTEGAFFHGASSEVMGIVGHVSSFVGPVGVSITPAQPVLPAPQPSSGTSDAAEEASSIVPAPVGGGGGRSFTTFTVTLENVDAYAEVYLMFNSHSEDEGATSTEDEEGDFE